MLPRGPFVENEGGRYAYVVDGGVAVRRPIQLGGTSVSAVEIAVRPQARRPVVIAGTDSVRERRARLDQQLNPITRRKEPRMLRMTEPEQGLPHPHDRDARAARLRHPRPRGRVRRRHRPVGLGQDHLPQHRRPARGTSPAASTCSTASTSRAWTTTRARKLRNEKLGFIFQGFNLIPDLNLFDNVDVPLRYRGFDAAERKRAHRGRARPRSAWPRA